ncbi:hypothetical protein ACSZME_06485 [Aeromonas dhakensis]
MQLLLLIRRQHHRFLLISQRQLGLLGQLLLAQLRQHGEGILGGRLAGTTTE